MKKIMWVVFAFTLFAVTSRAQDVSRADVSGGYSYLRSGGVNFNGGSGSIAFNTSDWLGIVADFGVYHASPSGFSVNAESFTFGPRISYRKLSRVVPFGQALFGGSHVSASFGGLSAGSSNPFAWTFGGGADFPFPGHDQLAFRPQFEYFGLHANGATANGARISVGIVYHIGAK